jgi:hypothetical protein
LAGKRTRDVDRNANTAAIAAALGLEPNLASKRISEPASEAVVARGAQREQGAEPDDELKRFHNLVTNIELPDWQFPYSLQHPEVTAADAPAMVEALRRAEEVTTETRDDQQYKTFKYRDTNIRFVLSKMIARLPENAYAPLVPQLLGVVRADTDNAEFSPNNWSLEARAGAGFMTRLSDAAPAAMVDFYLATLRKEHSPFDVQATDAQTTQRSDCAARVPSMRQRRKMIWCACLRPPAGTKRLTSMICTRRFIWHCCAWE